MNTKPVLYIIIEEQYSNTTWCASVCDGIHKEAAKRSIKVRLCNKQSLQRLPAGTIVVLLGSSYPFALEYVEFCTRLQLRPIIAGFEAFQTDMQVSYITVDRRRSMSDIVKALISCGARHIALLGINSSIQTDMHKYHGYADTVLTYNVGSPGEDVYYSDNGLHACMEEFWASYEKFDAIACANDYYAVQLCHEAHERGVRIPENLMITGYGNTCVSQFTNPTLTTVALNLSSLGTQVITLHRLLSRNPDLLSCNAALKSEIIFRSSTRQERSPLPELPLVKEDAVSQFEPTFEEQLFPIYALENILTTMDSTDFKLIQGLLDNESYNLLAEKLFLSDTAFKHRLYKLFETTGCKNRKELTSLILKYIPQYHVDSLI